MRLVYTATGEEVKVGDVARTWRDNEEVVVTYFRKPHSPASSGKVTVRPLAKKDSVGSSREYFVNIIGAEWIEREDRQ